MRNRTYIDSELRRLSRRRLIGASAALGGMLSVEAAFAWTWFTPTWPKTKQMIRLKFPDLPQLTVPQLKAWLDDSSRRLPVLIDVRSQIEFDDGHLQGAVRADDAGAAKRSLATAALDTPIVVYCSVGYRSAQVTQGLVKLGYTQVKNLEGSLFEWANAGLPVYQGNKLTAKVHPYDSDWGQLLRRELWSRVPQ